MNNAASLPLYLLLSTTMERADEADFIAILKLVTPFAFQLPISVIDQHQDAGPHGFSVRVNKELWALNDKVRLDVRDEVVHVGWTRGGIAA